VPRQVAPAPDPRPERAVGVRQVPVAAPPAWVARQAALQAWRQAAPVLVQRLARVAVLLSPAPWVRRVLVLMSVPLLLVPAPLLPVPALPAAYWPGESRRKFQAARAARRPG